MRQYEMYELEFPGPEPEDSCVRVDLRAVFSRGEMTKTVQGFYAGEGIYKIRFLPEHPGLYSWRTEGIVRREGTAACAPALPGRHGLVRADGTHFRYADGKQYYPFGTTVYALSHQPDALIEQTMETLSAAPFNKIRMCVFPKHYDFNHNEPPCFAFQRAADGHWDVHHPDYSFWDRLESHIRRLDAMGIQCDLILMHPYDRWGFADLSPDEVSVYLNYAVRRLAAFPNLWWSLANEYDLMKYTHAEWVRYAAQIGREDPYHHLLSNHHMIHSWDFSNPDTTHICIQTADVSHVSSYVHRYQKPLMVDECRYEGNIMHNWGNISGFEMVNRFWTVVAQGGYCTHGETFLDENEVLWWSKGGKLKGESPKRIRFLRDIVESLPGPLEFSGRDFTDEELLGFQRQMGKAPGEGILRKLPEMTLQEVRIVADMGRELLAHVGNQAFLKYYARECTAVGTLDLPESGSYDVEVIDVWEMTRKKVCSGASGKTTFPLPGKEGIAVLAREA